MVYKLSRQIKITKLQGLKTFETKELALISVFSSFWIVSEIYFGPMISQLTHIHGVIQRLIGWFLMLILAELTGKFGRVTAMAIIASIATRIIRPMRIYALFVGAGYILGGFIFDILYFFFRKRVCKRGCVGLYILGISVFSGTIAIIPYLTFKLLNLGMIGFMLWFPFYVPKMIKSIILNVIGTSIGISILPKIQSYTARLDK